MSGREFDDLSCLELLPSSQSGTGLTYIGRILLQPTRYRMEIQEKYARYERCKGKAVEMVQERLALEQLDSPFFPKLLLALHNERYTILGTELIHGLPMARCFGVLGKGLRDEVAFFYSCELVQILVELHERSIALLFPS